jgi:putative nucleotidyltransferase with HDIG domain
MIDPKEIIAGIKQLPAFSTTIVRLTALMQNPQVEPAQFEAIIQHDIGVTANLLRVANSAYYGFSRKIVSVREAITLLGMRRLLEIGSLVAMENVVPKTLPGYGLDSGAYWRHSVAVAILADRLAKVRKLVTPSYLFTAGLLHDIGKLVISSHLTQRMVDVQAALAVTGKSFTECERELLGSDHAVIGGELGKAWKLPEEIVEVIVGHHTPNDLNHRQGQVVVDLVHAADCLSHSLGFGSDIGELKRHVEDAAIVRLNIHPTDLETTASLALREIEELSQFIQRPPKGVAS